MNVRPVIPRDAIPSVDDPEPIDYDEAPYNDYFESEGFGLGAHRGEGGREWSREDLDPKTAVLGVERSEDRGDDEATDALGFPLPRVEAAGGVAESTVGGKSVMVFATPDGIHAFENPGYEFESAEPGGCVPSRRNDMGRGDRRERRRATTGPNPGPATVRVRVAGRPREGRVLVGGQIDTGQSSR